ncbi:hypothetical protein [Quadrisphaera sp. INWT6]|uniref:hypothetical protein n=1 Tax=Quadrisphaera sp. INWT6 TaxID=2596917 RepID=UPI0018922FA1|nr:hypothetical protein [Quadrisphaera sp. INWT6]MBF5080310.1 hypothetical protein [Quadrisphaera sp. INWT6]
MTATAPQRPDADPARGGAASPAASPTAPPGPPQAPAPRAARPSRWVRGRRVPAASSRATGLLRELARHAPLALAVALPVALLVGLLTGPLGARAEVVHRATTSGVVVPGSAGDTTDPDDAARVAAAYVAAATDPELLATAAAGTGWTAEQASERIAVALGETPGVVDVTVTTSGAGTSTEQAQEVAAAVLPALEPAVLAEHTAAVQTWTDQLDEQLAAVQAQLAQVNATAPGSADANRLAADAELRVQQLSRIERAQPPALMSSGQAVALPDVVPASTAGRAWRDAAVAFVVTALLVAALATALAGRRGHALTRATGRRLARRGLGSYLEVPRDPVGTSALLPLRAAVGSALAAGQQVVVLVAPGATRGEAASMVAPAGAGSAHLVVVNLDQPWWRYVDATRAAQVVLVAPYGSSSRALADEATTALAPLGAPVHVVLLTVPAGLTPFDVTTTGSLPVVPPAAARSSL